MQRRSALAVSRLLASTTLTQRRNFEHASFSSDPGRDYSPNSGGRRTDHACNEPSVDSLFECGTQFVPTFTTEMLGNVEHELNQTKNFYGTHQKGMNEYIIHPVSEADAQIATRIFAQLINDGKLSEWFDLVFKNYPAFNQKNCLGCERYQNEYKDFVLEAMKTIPQGTESMIPLCQKASLKLWEERHIAPFYFMRVNECLMEVLDQQPLTTPHDKRVQRRVIEIITKLMHNSLNELPWFTAHTGGEYGANDMAPFRAHHEPGLKEKMFGAESPYSQQ